MLRHLGRAIGEGVTNARIGARLYGEQVKDMRRNASIAVRRWQNRHAIKPEPTLMLPETAGPSVYNTNVGPLHPKEKLRQDRLRAKRKLLQEERSNPQRSAAETAPSPGEKNLSSNESTDKQPLFSNPRHRNIAIGAGVVLGGGLVFDAYNKRNGRPNSDLYRY